MDNDIEPKYDFDVHPPLSFMHYFTEQYMDATYQAVTSSGLHLEGKTLYDIGIGRGRSLAIFKALGVQKVVGFDVSKAETQFVQTQATRLGLDVAVVIDSWENDQLQAIPSNSVEVIAMMNILFCVRDERTRVTLITEVKRILKPGAMLIVVDMLRPSLMSFFSFLSSKPWTFRQQKELLKLMSPLSLLAFAPSNHFYSINRLMDIINTALHYNVCYRLNHFFKILHVPPSTATFVFTKDSSIAG
jgi:SAM-dependent methyltransferase